MHVEKNHYLVTALDEIILASTGTEKVGTTSYNIVLQDNRIYYIITILIYYYQHGLSLYYHPPINYDGYDMVKETAFIGDKCCTTRVQLL